MAAETEHKYKFIYGKLQAMSQELAKNSGWKPILISSAVNPSSGHEVCMVLEKVLDVNVK